MIDKELEAIFKCHELMKELDDDSKLRVFKYLLDRYNLVPTGSAFESANTHQPTLASLEESEAIEEESKPKPKVTKKKSSSSKPKISGTSTKSYSLITSLNLVSNGKESLKDFYAKYQVKNNFERNIVILYYLRRVVGEENIGINHIYTCYKHLSQKVPSIYQSLLDTKNRKGWVDTSNTDDLKVTVAGENYIEHEMATNS